MKRVDRIAVLVLAGLAVLAGFGLMFSTYMVYDDEGYVLFSLRNFVDGGGLYDRVFSQYGPFFFLWNQGLHFLGHDFSHTAGRLITLVMWFAATGGCAALVWRATRSGPATACTLAGVFLHLWPLINEPSHPGGLIVFLVALAAWLGSAWVDRPRRLAALAGTIGTALLLTKINTGVFLVAGAGLWWWLHLAPTADSKRCTLSVALMVVIALPVGLMRSKWGAEGVGTFMWVAAAAGAAVVLAAWRGAQPHTSWSDLRPAVAAGILLGSAVVILTLAQGTSLAGLVDGSVLQPLRFPSVYLALHAWRPGAALVAGVSGTIAALTVFRNKPMPPLLLAWMRLGVTGIGILTLVFSWPLNSQAFCLSYGLGLMWIFVLPLNEAERETQRLRTWLALLAVTQALHAFPVSGSQISWATFLVLPLAAVGTVAAARHVASAMNWDGLKGSRLVAAGLISAFALRGGETAAKGWQRLQEGDALGLPGTAGIQVPQTTASALRMLTLNAAAHGEMLFTLPGLNSLNLWSGLPAPTGQNATLWFYLLTEVQQEAIRERLAATPNAVVVVHRELLAFLAARGISTASSLTTFLEQEFETTFRIDAYEFRVRRGRQVPVLNAAELFTSDAPGQPRYRITLTLLATALANAATVELREFTGDSSRLLHTWKASLPERSAPADVPSRGGSIVRLHVPTDTFPSERNPDTLYFVIRDDAGRHLAEARMRR
jgi:hypothetical protein